MAKVDVSFNFGANKKPKAKKTKKGATKADAWRAYTNSQRRK
jgi:hypothetical protein